MPLSRWSADELAREAVARGICEQISGVTVWRWLSEDAIKPWQHRSWIFPRDPRFRREGRADPRSLRRPLARRAACTPATTSSAPTRSPRSRRATRKHATLPATRAIARGQRVEHEYERKGALCYLAAWDARHAKIFDRCAPKDGIVAVRRARRTVHEPAPLQRRPARLPHRRQRLRAPRPTLDRPPPRHLAQPRSSSTPPSTPAGSTRPRSTSPSSSARSSPPTTSPTSTHSSSSYWRSAAATSRSPRPSNGSSPAATSTSCSPRTDTHHATRPRRLTQYVARTSGAGSGE